MRKFMRAGAAVGISAGLLLLVAPPAGAGGVSFDVDVTGTAQCLPTGEAAVTWTATVSLAGSPGTSVIEIPPTIEIDGLKSPLGGSPQVIVQFEGVQNGAADGDVTFDPFQITIPASENSFPVQSQAVTTVPGAGGTLGLDVDVTFIDPLNPDDPIPAFGTGSMALPTCEASVAPTSAAVDATTKPRFTG